jgi:hypothetical protein
VAADSTISREPSGGELEIHYNFFKPVKILGM